jgi:hypothetical protein
MPLGTALLIIAAVYYFVKFPEFRKVVAVLAVLGVLGVGTVVYMGYAESKKNADIMQCALNVVGPEPSIVDDTPAWRVWNKRMGHAERACRAIEDGKTPDQDDLQ